MGYKEEILKKIESLRQFEKLRLSNREEAFKVKNLINVREDLLHVKEFLNYFTANKGGLFQNKDAYNKFIADHQDIIKDNRFPRVGTGEKGEINIPDVDYKAIFEAFEKDTGISEEALNEVCDNANPNIRAIRHPLTEYINAMKADADALFDENVAKELKESLDFANEEIIAKTGKNVMDDIFTINSELPGMNASEGFKDFVKKEGLNENEVVNKGSGKSIEAGLYNETDYAKYSPFLKMDVKIDEDYKNKLIALDKLLKDEGLLEHAAGGESGNKEYGLTDYFAKNYALKQAITDHAKLQSDEEKRASLNNIKNLVKETKEVSAKYDKVFNFIEKNFDVENINHSGNLYSGRPADVGEGGIDKWRPNLPPRYDFENSTKVVFLSGFTQLKAACQAGNVSLKEYLDNPCESFKKGVKNVSKIGDARYYPPRSQENTLGKRIAHTLTMEDVCYPHISGYNMIGGRGMEFLTNTNPNKENQIGNTIISSINKDFSTLYDHAPSKYFGDPFNPQVENIKNLFAFGDKEDDLYKVSNHYYDENAKKGEMYKQYTQTIKEKANVPIEQEYRRVMDAMRDYARQTNYMLDHQQEFSVPDQSGVYGGLMAHSVGTVLYAGKEYFVDYMKENNLSLASIRDEKLRNEITTFLTDPVNVLAKGFDEENSPESINVIRSNYNNVWRNNKLEEGRQFFQKFNEFNRKPNGRNVGKTFSKIVSDNKGSWWERLRGKTSKEYSALQKIAREACKEDSPNFGDDKALYLSAKAYKEYKMPEGTDFNSLSSTSKKRIEFCDSIIDAYEARERERQAQNQEAPQVDNNANNNIISQEEFHNQLGQDLNPQNEIAPNKNDVAATKSNEKDLSNENVEPNQLSK